MIRRLRHSFYISLDCRNLSGKRGGPLLCAGLMVHKAVKASDISAGERLAVFGVGGLGHLAVQIARAMDIHISAVDVSDETLEHEIVHKMIRSLGRIVLAL